MVRALSFISSVDSQFSPPPLKSRTVIGESHQEGADRGSSSPECQRCPAAVQNTGTYCSRDRYVASQSASDRSQQTSEPAFILTPSFLVPFAERLRSPHHPQEITRAEANALMAGTASFTGGTLATSPEICIWWYGKCFFSLSLSFFSGKK